jgi:hypothetical protein
MRGKSWLCAVCDPSMRPRRTRIVRGRGSVGDRGLVRCRALVRDRGLVSGDLRLEHEPRRNAGESSRLSTRRHQSRASLSRYFGQQRHDEVGDTRLRRGCYQTHAPASAYHSIRQHTSAYVSIRQHTSAYVSIRQRRWFAPLSLPDART